MSILDKFLKNPLLTLLAFSAICVSGYYSFTQIPIDAIPDISEKQVIVVAKWKGKSPKDIEDQVSYPLSVELLSVPKAKNVRAKSMYGFSFIQVTFLESADLYWARDRVNEALKRAEAKVPKEVSFQLGPDATALGQILYYVIKPKAEQSLADLRDLQDYKISYSLQSVEGVAEVATIGGYTKEYFIDIDPDKLRYYKLSLKDIEKATKKSNSSVGAGTLEDNKVEFILRSEAYLGSQRNSSEVISDLKNTFIPTDLGARIRLKDLANIYLGNAERRGALDLNGSEAVGGIVVMRQGENPRSVIAKVKTQIAQLQKTFQNVDIEIIYDRTGLIDETVATLSNALIMQIAITVLIVFLFILNLKTSFFIALSLPVSVLVCFLIMKIFGMSANIMSLAGIAIAIGNMVDMGIVVGESLHETLKAKEKKILNFKEKLAAVSRSLREIMPALSTASLTTIVSFLPIFMLTGRDFKLFAPLATTKSIALVAALLVSLILIPALFLKFGTWTQKNRNNTVNKNDFSEEMFKIYDRIFSLCFKFKYLTLALPVFILSLGLGAWYTVKSDGWIALDEGSLFYMPTLLPSTSFASSLSILQGQGLRIKEIPEVENVLGKIGRADTALDPAPVSMIETYVMLKPEKNWREDQTIKTIWNEVNSRAKTIGVTNAAYLQPIEGRVVMLQSGIKASMAVRLLGDDLGELERGATALSKALKDLESVNAGTLNPDIVNGKPYAEFKLKRDKLLLYGLSAEEINSDIAKALGGSYPTETIEGRGRYKVRLRYAKKYRDNLDQLKTLTIHTGNNQVIKLSDLATFETRWGPAVISSENAQLVAYVAFSPSGVLGDLETAKRVEEFIVGEKASGSLDELKNLQTDVVGSYQNQVEANKRLFFLVPLVILINILLIYLGLKNFALSLFVFTGIPLAFGGAMMAVLLSGTQINTAVWVGIIALIGICVDDGLLICTYINQKIKGQFFESRRAFILAVTKAAKKRLRPCLMTSATTLIALLPVLLSTGRGSDVAKAMAWPIFGGMSFALLGLILIPILFISYAGLSDKYFSNN